MRCAPLLAVCLGLIFGAGIGFADESAFQEITNVLQLRHLPERNTPAGYRFRLEGNILWANPPAGEFVLQDDSGAELLEMDLRGQTLRTGQRARVTGNGTVTQTGAR